MQYYETNDKRGKQIAALAVALYVALFAMLFLTVRFEMEYNPAEQCYEATVLLKQGAYDFMYLWVPDGSGVGQTAPAEGNFYEAENEYQVYIYHRPFGGRYDRLVAAQQVKFAQE